MTFDNSGQDTSLNVRVGVQVPQHGVTWFHLCIISITYHQYIFGLYKYILRLEISIFDRENTKNHIKFRINLCFWDIQSGGGISSNVGYQEIFSLSNILISPIDILIVPYDLLK